MYKRQDETSACKYWFGPSETRVSPGPLDSEARSATLQIKKMKAMSTVSRPTHCVSEAMVLFIRGD